MLYVYQQDESTIITHDGEVQLGIYHMDLNEFLSKIKVDYQLTYWIPDPLGKRYKKLSYQKHLVEMNKVTKENKLDETNNFWETRKFS